MKAGNSFLISFLCLALHLVSCSSSESKNNGNGPQNTKKDSSKLKDNKNSNPDQKNGDFSANMPGGFKTPEDDVGRKLLKEYGAMFIARNGAIPPNTVVFKDESEVSAFQASVQTSVEEIGGHSLRLQSAALRSLREAISEAAKDSLTISPRGSDSASRSYADTVGLWASRVNPGLKHWVGQGKLTETEAARIGSLTPFEQVPEIFKLEAQGMFFAKDLSKSIIYSVAPPGTSQHLSMLALDVSEHENSEVRAVLSRHGWFQTVVSDLPHFTYLGAKESELPGLGLRKVTNSGRTFWVPDV